MNNMLDVIDNAAENTEEFDKLIFPINVQESLAASGSLKRSEKTGLIVSFWVFISAIIGWFLAGWLRTVTPQYYLLITIVIELVLQFFVGGFILRFALDETTMLAEMNKQDNLFAKYFGIYHEILAEETNKYPFDAIEYSDGSHGVFVQLLLGHNTNARSSATYEVNNAIQQVINKSAIPHRVIYMNEQFGNSSSAQAMRDGVSRVYDPQLFPAYRDIVRGYLQIAEEESNVVCVTYILYAKTQQQKDELPQLVRGIMNTINAEDTVYREAYTMSYDQIVEFYRHYYRLDVLDMGLIRANVALKKNISCPIKVLKVYGKSGKTYATSDYAKLKEEIMRADGLQSAQ